jgi:hypothetical protein
MFKTALKKMAQGANSRKEWEKFVPYIQLAYNCTPQKTTNIAPSVVMMAQLPTLPGGVRDALRAPLDWNGEEEETAAASNLLLRARLVQQAGLLAVDNIEHAQMRDQWRFLEGREGTKRGRQAPQVGNYVYLNRPATDALMLGTRPTILRVVHVQNNGLVRLMGRDGRTIKRQMQTLELCLLPNVDPTMRQGDEEYEHTRCESCDSRDEGEKMLLCDTCDSGWHMQCLQPPLDAIPDGDWECPTCKAD